MIERSSKVLSIDLNPCHPNEKKGLIRILGMFDRHILFSLHELDVPTFCLTINFLNAFCCSFSLQQKQKKNVLGSFQPSNTVANDRACWLKQTPMMLSPWSSAAICQLPWNDELRPCSSESYPILAFILSIPSQRIENLHINTSNPSTRRGVSRCQGAFRVSASAIARFRGKVGDLAKIAMEGGCFTFTLSEYLIQESPL